MPNPPSRYQTFIEDSYSKLFMITNVDAPIPRSVLKNTAVKYLQSSWLFLTGGAALRFAHGVEAGVHDVDFFTYDFNRAVSLYGKLGKVGDTWISFMDGPVLVNIYDANNIFYTGKPFPNHHVVNTEIGRAASLESLLAQLILKIAHYLTAPSYYVNTDFQKHGVDGVDVETFHLAMVPELVRETVEVSYRVNKNLFAEFAQYVDLKRYVPDILERINTKPVEYGFVLCHMWWGFKPHLCKKRFLEVLSWV